MECEDIREVRREVRDYVVSSFYVPSPDTLADSASLIHAGVLDQSGVLAMVAFLTSTFGIRIDEIEITPENLGSIAKVAAFVCRKKSSGEPLEEANDLAVDDVGMSHGGHMADAFELDHIDAG